MSSEPREDSGTEPSVAELEEDIRRSRQELGETVEALSAKLDVKAQIKSSTDQARTHAVDAASAHWREAVVIAVWAALVTIIWKKFP